MTSTSGLDRGRGRRNTYPTWKTRWGLLLEALQGSTWQGFFMEVNMLDRFKEFRIELLDRIERMESLSSLRESGKVRENLAEIREKLSQNTFHLVVIGQFKRGKSTFINSIIGDRLLPTSVVPLTSIVTLLKYGPGEGIEVIFENGNRKTITRDNLTEYVTEKGNPGNGKKVKQVEIVFPSDYLRDGMIIVDTPGVGSTFENNTEMTYNYLPKVDAALFLLAVDPPISQSEIHFLKEVQKYVEKIFFIQNKIDYLSDEERRESMVFSKKVIEEALGMDGIKIHPLSAKMALEGKLSQNKELLEKSRLPEFDRVLGEFLLKAKGKTILRAALNGTRRLLSDEELSLELEKKAIGTPLEILEQRLKIFKEKMDVIKRDREDIRYYFEGEIKRLIDFLDRDLGRMKEREVSELTKKLEETAKAHENMNIAEYGKLLESTFNQTMVKDFNEWVAQEEERLNREYAQVSKRYSERTNEVIDTIVKTSAELFDLEIEKYHSEEAIVSDRGLYYMLGDTPKFFDLEGAIDFFSQKVLPRKLSRGLILKDLIKSIYSKIDMNCGRVRWDFMDRMKRSFMTFAWDLNLKIDATEEGIRKSIDKALELKKRSQVEVNKAEEIISGQLDQIGKLRNELQDLEKAMSSL